ncbi:OB-fold protein [uncultured Clostridium sp.]|uniref:OB-fold protein n=1 Tax=uncultured Clostridium sp. TaxID=59620 RepID=UPI0028EB60AC|nr:hypothetical protein [uncultured Clostridium sp.]
MKNIKYNKKSDLIITLILATIIIGSGLFFSNKQRIKEKYESYAICAWVNEISTSINDSDSWKYDDYDISTIGDTIKVSGTLLGKTQNESNVNLDFKRKDGNNEDPISNVEIIENDTYTDFKNHINTFVKNNTVQQVAQKTDVEIKINAKELYKSYDANEVNADNLYSGKIGVVTGKIRKISVTSGKPCISLSDGKEGSILGVNCYFNNNNQSEQIANLKKGNTITIKGKIRGKSVADVCLDNCEVQ